MSSCLYSLGNIKMKAKSCYFTHTHTHFEQMICSIMITSALFIDFNQAWWCCIVIPTTITRALTQEDPRPWDKAGGCSKTSSQRNKSDCYFIHCEHKSISALIFYYGLFASSSLYSHTPIHSPAYSINWANFLLVAAMWRQRSVCKSSLLSILQSS